MSHWKIRYKGLLFFILVLVSPTIFSATLVTPTTVTRAPHLWTMTFNVKGPLSYSGFSLHNPNRFVLDINQARLSKKPSASRYVGTPINRIRVGRRKNHDLRLVFDLDYPVKIKLYLLKGKKNHKKLVLKLIGKRQVVKGFSWPTDKNTIKRAQTPALPKSVIKATVTNRKSVKALPVITAPLKKKRPQNIIVVIDPGHGGKDPGASGPGGHHEKTVVLAISKVLQRSINKLPGFKAYSTRKGDYYLTLRQRLVVARRYKADMFIAIHADAWKNRSASGASVYALSRRGATSEAARWLAARENKSELMGGLNLSNKSNVLRSVLINLSQTATIRASLIIGEDLIQSLRGIVRLHHGKVEQAAFVVLKSPDIPSLLVETGFISNPYEERRLRSPRFQQRLATQLARGIQRYFRAHPPRDTWLAYKKYHPQSKSRRYTVAKGDTLNQISRRYKVSLNTIKRINRLNNNRLRIGQVLQLPS